MWTPDVSSLIIILYVSVMEGKRQQDMQNNSTSGMGQFPGHVSHHQPDFGRVGVVDTTRLETSRVDTTRGAFI